MKKSYAQAINKPLKDLPKKGTFRKEIKLKHCIPEYIKFNTPILQNLLEELKKKKIKQTDGVEKHLVLYKRLYVLGKGGLHADQKNEIWEANNDFIIEDDDVSSYYPKIIVNNGYYPHHLGKELLKTYTEIYNKRITLKPLAKKDKKIKGIVDALKLVCNAIFGKMGSMESWLFDMQSLLSVTITGELTLLMLLESFEMNGIPVISANTDGITSRFHKDKKDLKDKLVNEWQQLTNFEIETVRFKKMYYSTVNDYLAIKEGIDKAVEKKDFVKCKGDFIFDFELYKNKSSKIVPLALSEYFVNGKDPIEFIKNHKNIYDFCIMTKATGQLHLEMQKIIKRGDQIKNYLDLINNGWTSIGPNDSDKWIKNELIGTIDYSEDVVSYEEAKYECEQSLNEVEIRKLKKLVRYYLTTDKEWRLFKRGIGTTGKNANISCNAPNEIGNIYITYFNQFEEKDVKDYNIDYNQYIFKTLKIISKIERNKKDKNFVNSLKEHLQILIF